MLCKRDSDDPLLRTLVQRYGMNLLVPARAGIAPGDLVVAEKGGPARRADWLSVFGVAPAAAIQVHPFPKSLAFGLSNEISIDGGLTLAGQLLSGLGIPASKLKAGFQKTAAATIKFEVLAPSEAELANLDQMLDSLASGPPQVAARFAKMDTYIVTRAYHARGLKLVILDKLKIPVSVSAKIAGELEAGAKVGVFGAEHGSYDFATAATPLVFGITVRQLIIEDGKLRDVAQASYLPYRTATDNDKPIPRSYIPADSAFVDMED